MNKARALTAIIPLLLLAVPNVVAPAAAAPFTGGTSAWTLQGQPFVTSLNGQPTAKLTYMSNVTIPLALVYVDLRNSMGQTVFVNGGTVGPVAAGANATAYVVIFNVPSGSYNATFFATLPSGAAISVAKTAAITI